MFPGADLMHLFLVGHKLICLPSGAHLCVAKPFGRLVGSESYRGEYRPVLLGCQRKLQRGISRGEGCSKGMQEQGGWGQDGARFMLLGGESVDVRLKLGNWMEGVAVFIGGGILGNWGEGG